MMNLKFRQATSEDLLTIISMVRGDMTRKIKHYTAFIFLCCFSFLINGCGNATQNPVQTKNKSQEIKSLIIPQYELIETPEYKELKQRVEKAQIEVNEIEIKRTKMLVIYKQEHVSHQKISKDLKEAERKLFELKTLLNSEEGKLERRLKNPPV